MPVNSFADYPMSWKPDIAKLKRPIYLSLAAMLEQDIAGGILTPGTKLPPQRELADYLDINFTTVTRTYKLCELKGLIHAVTGSGTFVSTNAARSVTISLDNTPGEYIEMGFVASFEQCNHVVADSAKKVMGKKYLEQLFNYGAPTGMPHHKMAGLHWMESFGIHALPEDMAIVSGTQNALAVTLFALFEPGNRIAVDRFTFSNFIELAKIYHVQLIPIRGDHQGMLAQELENQCRLVDIQGIFLMPSCGNPATVMISDKRKHELAQVIRKYGLILIEDDIHAFLTAGIITDYKQPMYQLLPQQTVYICGTSKSICSGLRVAYMVFDSRLRERILKAIFNINVKTSSLDVEIITELIRSGGADEISVKKRHLAQAVNQMFSKYFPEVPINGHPLSFYRWLPIPEDFNSSKLLDTLPERGVHVFHSDRFRIGGGTDENYLRVALASTNSLKQLETGLEILRDTFMDFGLKC